MGLRTLHAFVSGRVQGVFFRKYTKECADKLGITGFVQNLSDGRVEVKASGEEEALSQLLIFLMKGEGSAVVKKVEYAYEDYEESPSFQIN